MNYVELIGTICGIIGVYLTYKNSYWGFIIGLMNTIIYIAICWQQRLYGESFLNFYYSIMNLLGWIKWSKKTEKNKQALSISSCSLKQWILSLLILLLVWFGLAFIQKKYTNSAAPFTDSFIVATSYIAMVLLVYKKIENWIGWILVNLISIILFYQRGLWITCFQYIFLLVLAIVAYFEWRKKISKTIKN